MEENSKTLLIVHAQKATMELNVQVDVLELKNLMMLKMDAKNALPNHLVLLQILNVKPVILLMKSTRLKMLANVSDKEQPCSSLLPVLAPLVPNHTDPKTNAIQNVPETNIMTVLKMIV